MKRADELITDLGFAASRSKARALIEEGKVFCNGKPVDKPSRKFDENTVKMEVDSDSMALRFVSRAGLKLEAYLEKFDIDLNGARILDAGASTGGFTDCALSRGAALSFCVDVGTGQLHSKLLQDPRVKNFEKTDVRSLTPQFFDEVLFDFICADLSFISLEKVLPTLWSLLKPLGCIVCLVKPQFETSPAIMHKNKGILRDSILREEALKKIESFALDNFPTAHFIGRIESPIKGGDGNVEYLIGYRK